MKDLSNEKFAIIGGDIHRLVSIRAEEDKVKFDWLIHEKDDLYWVPVPDHKKKNEFGKWVWDEPFSPKRPKKDPADPWNMVERGVSSFDF